MAGEDVSLPTTGVEEVVVDAEEVSAPATAEGADLLLVREVAIEVNDLTGPVLDASAAL
jgi:hypothetical protein